MMIVPTFLLLLVAISLQIANAEIFNETGVVRLPPTYRDGIPINSDLEVSRMSLLSNSITTYSYIFTGDVQWFYAPSSVTSVWVSLYGASGGNNERAGYGGKMEGSIPVTPGSYYAIYVGGAGEYNSGGYNGGGTPSYAGFGGGGSTDFRLSTGVRALVAGGGGGGMYSGCVAYGGDGGWPAGSKGGIGCSFYCGGYGGTQTLGGTASSSSYCYYSSNAGSWYYGGSACSSPGAGGGGGYYGGGGSYAAGGGGGSSYAAFPAYYLNGANLGNGRAEVTITWPKTRSPTARPVSPPTRFPTRRPSRFPTERPIAAPTRRPSFKPSRAPTNRPITVGQTMKPSSRPTLAPSARPIAAPTRRPSFAPSRAPTKRPITFGPTMKPSSRPTLAPSSRPIAAPTRRPSFAPSRAPTKRPITFGPTMKPSSRPTLAPSSRPIAAPTRRPSFAPSRAPTKRPITTGPTIQPSLQPSMTPSATTAPPSLSPTGSFAQPKNLHSDGYELFAVVGGGACAENLFYGTSRITEAGSIIGTNPFYLSTSTTAGKIEHQWWLQIVTSDGTTELFRTYWRFDRARTLQARFGQAAVSGMDEAVSYEIHSPVGTTLPLKKTGHWVYSSAAITAAAAFDTQSVASCCFSLDDGAWGAAQGSAVDGALPAPKDFWGIGNFHSSDNTCSAVYQDGKMTDFSSGTKVYMYLQNTFANIQVQVVQKLRNVDYTVYLSNSEAFASVVTEGLLEVIPGVVRSDLQELTITSAQTAKFAKKVTKDLHPSNLRNGEEEGLKPLDMYTAAEEPAILVKLTLTFTAPGASYIQVAGQLFAADEAHFFDHALRKSAARYNISALSSVMSTILSVAEVTATITPSTEVNEQNVENVDAAAIVGGVLGGALFLLLVAVIGYMYWRSTTSGGRSILPIADPVSGGDPLGDIFCEVLPQPSAPPLPRRN